jgi:hypothetical protein
MAGTSPDNVPRNRQDPDGGGERTLPASGALSVADLLAYAEKVFAGLANNRDLRLDEAGNPSSALQASGETREAVWAHFDADFSAIGMATNMPLFATAYADEASIEWSFGSTPIGKSPRTATPKEAAEILDMNRLLDAFRRFVEAESALFPESLPPPGEGGPVLIDPKDGCCPGCSGTLELVGVDEGTMTVECRDGCGALLEMEHDAVGGGRDYVLRFLARRGWG